MKLDPLVLVAVAGGAFLLLRQQQAEEAPPPPPRSGGGAGGASGILDGLSQGIGGFFAGAGEGIGRAIGGAVEGGDLGNEDSDLRRNIRRGGEKWQLLGNKLTGGLIKDPTKKRKKKREAEHAFRGDLASAELFAARVHQDLSGPDVTQWVLSSRGRNGNPIFDVFTSDPAKAAWSIEVPERAGDMRLAWAAEPVVRALRVFTQRGRRFGEPFVRYTIPAYSDRNPYAPQGTRVSDVGALSINYELRNAERIGKKLSSKNVQKFLEQAAAEAEADDEDEETEE